MDTGVVGRDSAKGGSLKNVVVWGCPRSGTSVGFGVFRTHPGYRFFFEPGTWLIPEMDRSYPLALKNPWSEHPTGGLSADLVPVLELDAVHIWMVRNPTDAVASLRRGMAEQPHPPTLPPRWLDKPLIDRCAALWRLWNETGLRNLQLHVEPLRVKYEDLVTRPNDTFLAMLEHAQAPWTYETDLYLTEITNVPGRNEVDFQFRWHYPHPSHVGGHDLTELDLVTIANIVGDVPALVGY